ncbi:hypothetical protein WME95_45825 [Sorangium sp. So ce327]|uniref:hypothetical protein n=1 Tax=Sorangium sp. So ce327 TaxID=3133301 RepID=UPI003F6138D5
MTIARRLFIEHLRFARRERLDAPDTLDGATPTRTAVPPDEELATRRMAGAVEQVLGGLPARQVEAFRPVPRRGATSTRPRRGSGLPRWRLASAAHWARASIRRHLGEAWWVAWGKETGNGEDLPGR